MKEDKEKAIHAEAKNLSSLLRGAKFSIEYYQREYNWKEEQVKELIMDLVEKFYESYKSEHKRSEVKKYDPYFLGSIIISIKEEQKFIVDGQQRLTTLTLILIYLNRHLKDSEEKPNIEDLILSEPHAERSFNINVEERKSCMKALFDGDLLPETKQPESVTNIYARFRNIEEVFHNNELTDAALSYFADWLIENVYLIEITTYSDTEAYTIFETMNDRGLAITPTEMLKGYILTNIEGEKLRNNIEKCWKKRVSDLRDISEEADADAIKAWLRSQYAETIGEKTHDYNRIGTGFHRWVSDHEGQPELSESPHFVRFIETNFDFYGQWYAYLRKAAKTIIEDNLPILYCAQNGYTWQYPVLLAPLRQDDLEPDIKRKFRIVSAYLDILITRRIWNRRRIGYSTMRSTMFSLIKEIRGKDISTLKAILKGHLDAKNETFNDNFRLRHNWGKMRLILARLTDYVETSSGMSSRYEEYTGYDIEHILADHDDNKAEFGDEFDEYRHRIGCLLLLPPGTNRSFSNSPYDEKLPHYYKENLLAGSLNGLAYDKAPEFRKFISETKLPFKPHPQFKKADCDARQELYRLLAEEVWNPQRITEEAES